MARTVLHEQIFLVSLAVSVATCDITGNRQILLSLLYALWKERILILLCFSLNRCFFVAGSLLTFPAYKLAGYLGWLPIQGWALNRINRVFDRLPHFLIGLSL